MLPFGTNALRNAFTVQEMQRWSSVAMPSRVGLSASSSATPSATTPSLASLSPTASSRPAVSPLAPPMNNGGIYLKPMGGILIPNRIFVGGISPETTEEDLRRVFSSFGTVRSTRVIVDESGISKGYGFVTFETERDVTMLLKGGEFYTLRSRNWNIAPAVKRDRYSLNQRLNSGFNYNGSDPFQSLHLLHNNYAILYAKHAAAIAAAAAAASAASAAAIAPMRFDLRLQTSNSSKPLPLNAGSSIGNPSGTSCFEGYSSPRQYTYYMMPPMSSPRSMSSASSPSASLAQYLMSQQLR